MHGTCRKVVATFLLTHPALNMVKFVDGCERIIAAKIVFLFFCCTVIKYGQ